MVVKIHQLFRGRDLILSLSLTPSAQGGFSLPSWKLGISVISLCLLDVQAGAAASGGYMQEDARQVECAVLQGTSSMFFTIQEGTWYLAACCDVQHMWLVEEGLCPSGFRSATSCRTHGAELLWRCSCDAGPCHHAYVSLGVLSGPLSSLPNPTLPAFHSKPLFLQFSTICYLPVSVSDKPQFRWVIWGCSGLSVHSA